jgi:hypothetical protein
VNACAWAIALGWMFLLSTLALWAVGRVWRWRNRPPAVERPYRDPFGEALHLGHHAIAARRQGRALVADVERHLAEHARKEDA